MKKKKSSSKGKVAVKKTKTQKVPKVKRVSSKRKGSSSKSHQKHLIQDIHTDVIRLAQEELHRQVEISQANCTFKLTDIEGLKILENLYYIAKKHPKSAVVMVGSMPVLKIVE